MMFGELTDPMLQTIRSAAQKLTGFDRRQFQAEVTLQYCGGSARKAESTFGWGREAVTIGLNEMRSGFRCLEDFSARGRHKTEELHPELVEAIQALVEPNTQADPKFQSPLAFTRMTAEAVRTPLIQQAENDDPVPAERTLRSIFQRLGYRLRRVRKTIPQKKLPQTNAIFDHLRSVHLGIMNHPDTLRISIDTKAKVKIGPFSRRGLARAENTVRAADHDMHPLAVLAPAGILEVVANQLNVVFGTSHETSDFLADVLELWWNDRREVYPGVRRLRIDLDNGPQIASSRTQFMKRWVDFSDRHQLTLELAYYPPYHSQYNGIERCWGILENHWNGAILSSIETALNWAGTMTWRGVSPLVHLLDRVYETGVRIKRAAFKPIAARLQRSATLPKWSLMIEPQPI